ncbi:MAG: hypothetical protein K8R40_03295 [Anaerolineaceae bacterium]|nr:hypothetical protein [Anaerolineaceae bacterium]
MPPALGLARFPDSLTLRWNGLQPTMVTGVTLAQVFACAAPSSIPSIGGVMLSASCHHSLYRPFRRTTSLRCFSVVNL